MLPGCFFCWWAVTWAVEIIHFVIDLHQRHLSSFRRDGCLLSCSVRHSYVTTQNGHPQLAASAFHNARVVLFCQDLMGLTRKNFNGARSRKRLQPVFRVVPLVLARSTDRAVKWSSPYLSCLCNMVLYSGKQQTSSWECNFGVRNREWRAILVHFLRGVFAFMSGSFIFAWACLKCCWMNFQAEKTTSLKGTIVQVVWLEGKFQWCEFFQASPIYFFFSIISPCFVALSFSEAFWKAQIHVTFVVVRESYDQLWKNYQCCIKSWHSCTLLL